MHSKQRTQRMQRPGEGSELADLKNRKKTSVVREIGG